MSGSPGSDEKQLGPALGTVVTVLPEPGGKWAVATVVPPPAAGGGSAPPALPTCLQYKDGSVDWVRFLGASVLERARRTPGRRGQAAAATEVCAYVVGDKARGRQSNAQAAAKAAADELRMQRSGGQQGSEGDDSSGDGGSGSPPKRRRVAAAAAPAADESQRQPADSAAAAPRQASGGEGRAVLSPGGKQRQRLLQVSEAPAVEEQQDASREAAVPLSKAKPSPAAAAATAAVKRSRPGALQQSLPPAAVAAAPPRQRSAPAAAAAQAATDAHEQQAAVPTPQEQEGVQPLTAEPPADQKQAAAAGASAQPADAPAAAAVPAQPAKLAVTELGSGPGLRLKPLATVPMGSGEDEDEEGGTLSPPEMRRSLAASPAGKHSHPQLGHPKQRHQQHSHERPRSRESTVRPPSSAGHPASLQQGAEEPPAPAVVERPGDRACRAFAELLPGLSAPIKEKIKEAAAAAVEAGRLGACKEVVRSVLAQMDSVPAGVRRVALFYLLDAVLAMSRKEVVEGCGPTSAVGTLFPRTVGAALSQLVELLGASADGAQTLERTLQNTWAVPGKRGVEPSLVQYALQQLRARAAQQEADADASMAAAAAAAAAGPGSQRSAAAGKQRGSGDATDQSGLLRMISKTPMQAAPLLTFVNIKDGSRVQLTHKWQPDVWPDYSALPLPPGAERGQYAYRVAQAVVQPPSAPGMEAPDSPWHASYDAAFWAAQGFDPSTAHVPARRDAAAAAAAAAAAGNSAALYEQQRMAAQLTHQRLLLQQQRARGMSTAAAAEADEFDAGLFKEAAGGVMASAADANLPVLPDLLRPLGGVPWGADAAPPLPDQPPPPEDDWDDEEEELGPPPLPPHSPPRDEYEMEMEIEGDTPPLPPPDDDEDAPPPLPTAPAATAAPPPGSGLTSPPAVQPGAGSYPNWGGYGALAPDYGAAAGVQAGTAAPVGYQAQGGWPALAGTPAAPPAGMAPTLQPHPEPQQPQPQPYPQLPPGIGVGAAASAAATPSAAMAQQQQQRQPPWAAAQHQQRAFLMQAQHAAAAQMQQHVAMATQAQQATQMQQVQQAAAMMVPPGMIPPGMLPPSMQQLYPPGINPLMAAQHAAAVAAMGLRPGQGALTPGQPPRPQAPPPSG